MNRYQMQFILIKFVNQSIICLFRNRNLSYICGKLLYTINALSEVQELGILICPFWCDCWKCSLAKVVAASV